MDPTRTKVAVVLATILMGILGVACSSTPSPVSAPTAVSPDVPQTTPAETQDWQCPQKSGSVLPSLIDGLSSEDPLVRFLASERLAKRAGDKDQRCKVIACLVDALENEHSAIALQAATVLGQIRAQEAVGPLLKALQSRDETAGSNQKIPSPELDDWVGGPNAPFIGHRSLFGLGRTRFGASNERQKYFDRVVVRALGQIGPPAADALPELFARLNMYEGRRPKETPTGPFTRDDLIQIATQIKDRSPVPLVANTISRLGPMGNEALIAIATSPQTARSNLEALKWLDDVSPQVVSFLFKALGDADPSMREKAAYALIELVGRTQAISYEPIRPPKNKDALAETIFRGLVERLGSVKPSEPSANIEARGIWEVVKRLERHEFTALDRPMVSEALLNLLSTPRVCKERPVEEILKAIYCFKGGPDRIAKLRIKQRGCVRKAAREFLRYNERTTKWRQGKPKVRAFGALLAKMQDPPRWWPVDVRDVENVDPATVESYSLPKRGNTQTLRKIAKAIQLINEVSPLSLETFMRLLEHESSSVRAVAAKAIYATTYKNGVQWQYFKPELEERLVNLLLGSLTEREGAQTTEPPSLDHCKSGGATCVQMDAARQLVAVVRRLRREIRWEEKLYFRGFVPKRPPTWAALGFPVLGNTPAGQEDLADLKFEPIIDNRIPAGQAVGPKVIPYRRVAATLVQGKPVPDHVMRRFLRSFITLENKVTGEPSVAKGVSWYITLQEEPALRDIFWQYGQLPVKYCQQGGIFLTTYGLPCDWLKHTRFLFDGEEVTPAKRRPPFHVANPTPGKHTITTEYTWRMGSGRDTTFTLRETTEVTVR